MTQYRDIMFGSRSLDNKQEIRNAYMLHAVNHVALARDRITKNNTRLEQAQEQGKDIGELRDQGFTRPKVLILLPFRNAVVDVVNTLMKLYGNEHVQNKKRFFDQYNLRDQDDALNPDKPADYLDTFRGNIDDHFRLGIKLTKKSIKLYSEFYHSDILVCSPLGLKTLIGSEGDKKRDFDYLSSIEMLIIDQATDLTMQNWDHVDHVFKHLNLIPVDAHDCDISRIKNWYLDGKAKYLRQTLVFGTFLTPELNAVYNRHFVNASGRLKIKHAYEGAIMDVTVDVPQQFIRVDSTSLAAMNDARFKYFVEKTLPSLRKSAMMQAHTLFFIPSYFDFVRVRNYLEDNKYSYEPCCEYTSSGGITRARAQFFHGRTNFLLYTERLHFFRRFNLRGAYHIVFYGLPEHPQFYNEIVDFLGLKVNDHASAAEEATFSCTVLFSKYDFLKLERVVGTERAKKMCTAQKNTFQFA
ncbi:digestive organ expansion factor [Gongronella butleri]|nr:digestive organ expansion factor [Gongronella butleri]